MKNMFFILTIALFIACGEKSANELPTALADASDLDVYENNGSRVFVRIFKDSVKEFVVIK